jgi:hypothetical protein
MSAEERPRVSAGAVVKTLVSTALIGNFALTPLLTAPSAVVAAAGQGPKQSVFGIGGDAASSPFVVDTETYSPYSPYGKDGAVYKPL